MVAHQLEPEEKNGEEENGMVTLVVTIDKDLLRMVDASLQAGSAAGLGEEAFSVTTKNDPGELPTKNSSDQKIP